MSESVHSGLSRRSKNPYRRLARSSNVDETLFASDHHDSASKLRDEIKLGKREISKETKAKPVVTDIAMRKATVVTKQRFDDIKRRSLILTKEERSKLREEREAERLTKMAKAEARKERMKKLEAERRKKVVKTEEELEDEVQLNASLAKAADQRLEQVDQIKTMRRKMVYAQCAKIREAQVQAKKDLEEQRKAQAERLDIIMEIDRLEKIKKMEEDERKRTENCRKDAQQIREQIETRKTMKILADERVEQEKQQMKQTIRQQELEEIAKRKAKAIAGKKLLEEVLQANEMAIQQKLERKRQEKEEDDRILEWQMAKRAQEEKLEAEKAAFKAAQDRQFFEVASKMKRSQDNRSEEDALRAKRHQQEQERRERTRERNERETRKRQIRELMAARKLQSDAKVDGLKALAIQDKLEWEKINRENNEIQSRYDEVILKQQAENLAHQKELREQMARNEKAKQAEREFKRKEGEDLRRENAAFLKRIEKKKLEILEEMRAGNIPDKFCAEVERMKIELN